MIDKIKSLLFVGIPFLMFCSAIYQITFWGDFNLNGLEIVSLEDVIKTSIFPFTKTFYESFLIFGILIFSTSSKKKDKKNEKELTSNMEKASKDNKHDDGLTRLEILKEKSYDSFSDGLRYRFLKIIMTFSDVFNRKFFVLLSMLVFIPLILSFEFSAKWYMLFLVITLPIAWLISTSIFFEENKSNWSVFGVAFVIIAFPVFSFISGKSEAYKILKGYDYNYIIKPDDYSDNYNIKDDTLKFIGFSSDLSVFVGKNNKHKYFLETSKIGPLKHFKKKSPLGILH